MIELLKWCVFLAVAVMVGGVVLQFAIMAVIAIGVGIAALCSWVCSGIRRLFR